MKIQFHIESANSGYYRLMSVVRGLYLFYDTSELSRARISIQRREWERDDLRFYQEAMVTVK